MSVLAERHRRLAEEARLREKNGVLIARERLRVSYRYRPADMELGRFGGGWQWSLGFDASAGFRTVILNLLVFSLRIRRGREK